MSHHSWGEPRFITIPVQVATRSVTVVTDSEAYLCHPLPVASYLKRLDDRRRGQCHIPPRRFRTVYCLGCALCMNRMEGKPERTFKVPFSSSLWVSKCSLVGLWLVWGHGVSEPSTQQLLLPCCSVYKPFSFALTLRRPLKNDSLCLNSWISSEQHVTSN